MEDEMDYNYDEAEFISHMDNRLTVHNIYQLNEPPQENETLRAVKFLQLLNMRNANHDNTSQATPEKVQLIMSLLYNSRNRLDDLMMFLNLATLDKSLYKFKVINFDNENKTEREELNKINYLKKIDCFSKTIEKFNKCLKEISEQNRISQIIFRELTSLKEIGFYVEDSFQFPEGRENINVKLIHKLLKIYDNLNIFSSETNEENSLKKFNSKFCFDLNYNVKTSSFDLSSKFYANFIKKFKINFEMRVNTEEGELMITRNNFESILDELIAENLNLNSNYSNHQKYQLKTFLNFYTKYFLYILFKWEIRSLMKISQNNFIENQNFQILLNEDVKEYTMTLIHFNFMEIKIKIGKGDKEDFDTDNIVMSDSEKVLEESMSSSDYKRNYYQLVKTFIRNLISEMRFYKIIKDLSLINQNFQSAKDDLLDSSIFAKNLTKISSVILRKSLINVVSSKVDREENFHSIKTSNMNLHHNIYTYKFVMIKNSNSPVKIEFHIVFNKSSISIEIQNPLKNNIYTNERETISDNCYKNMDLHYLIMIVDNLIKNKN